jgi:hypothetical protein
MSFLAPLYALGLLAITAPIWFHLIRRRPKGQVPFSSLMFLTASPPPPAQRRRLDQIILLLLRVSALILLGFAFMRPFLRLEEPTDTGGAGERVLILIDTSASMRRGDLWQKAIAQAEEALAGIRPGDRLGLYAFDRTLRPILTFEEGDQLDASQRLAVARDRLKQLKPTWGRTELGQALIDSVGLILSGSNGGRKSGKVVLVSDLPQGAKLTGLNAFEWPEDVELEPRIVTDDRGNAGLDFLPDRADAEKTAEPSALRVRVVNDGRSRQEQFRLTWAGTTGAEIEAYIPPGESRVVKVPRPPANLKSPVLKLLGDAHDFDNALHFTPPHQQEMTVFFLGEDEANAPAGLRYFLDRAWGETPERIVRVLGRKPGEPLSAADVRPSPLVVMNGEVPEETVGTLEKYLRDGGTVLSVLTRAGPAKSLAQLTGLPALEATEAPSERYAMLKDIAFDHPLFSPLSGPQFGDFTKVHFWKHRRLSEPQLGGAKVLAQFDNGDPAVMEKVIGRGRLVVLTSGWQPTDSQLARSSKFVPLMSVLIELRGGKQSSSGNVRVDDRVPLAPEEAAAGVTVRKPDGSTATVPTGTSTFDGTDQPGVYTFEAATGPRSFAVNLDPSESLTSPLPSETLEQLGCKIAKRSGRESQDRYERQQRDIELERNQSLWRGLILAAIFVLLVETTLAGRRNRSTPREVTS